MMFHSTQCMYDLLTTDFDSSTNTFSDREGIHIGTQNFGGFSDVSWVYWSFPRDVESWGYQLNRNLFGAPYDYRYMSNKSFLKNGFYQQLKELVEKAYLLNGKNRVLLMGHSNGGPTMYGFLTSHFVSQEWKDTFIAGMVGLSGNFLGQMNMLRSYIAPMTEPEQVMIASWEASYGTCPWGGYDAVNSIKVVTTHVNTSEQRSYTTKLADLVDMYTEAGHADWAAMTSSLYVSGTMDRSAHPLVNVHCLYGSNVSTDFSYELTNGINENSRKEVVVHQMEGDGNQDYIDNEFCNVWKSDARSEASSYFFESQAFPNVRHMQMVSDADVLEKIHAIVKSYVK